MNKILLCAAAFAAALLLPGAGTPAAAPKTAPDFPQQADLWINGGSPVKTDMGRERVADSFSGTILRKLDRLPETGEFSAVYEFQVSRTGEYDFFAALIAQKRPHSSPVEFRFDGDGWREAPATPPGAPAWGVSNAVTWTPLGSRKLKAGKHTLSFRITRRAQLGSWSFMCDGIAGFRKGVWKNASIDGFRAPADITPGTTAVVTYRQAGEAFPAELRLTFAGEPAVSLGVMSRNGENRFRIDLPEQLPPGRYRFELVPLDAPGTALAGTGAELPRPPVPPPARLASAELDGCRYALKFEEGRTAPVLAMAFAEDGKLYGASRLDAAAGDLPEALTELARGRKIEVRFRPLPAADGNLVSCRLTLPGPARKLPKPVNYGGFTDRDGVLHTWYMNREFEYIFDGERYFPVGGMWCPDTLISPDNDPAGIAARLEKDLATLRAIRQGGLDDVYLNLSTQAPLRVRQLFIDMLEREGIHYGYQLTAGGGSAIPSFFITRDRPDAPGNYRGLTRGTYASGRITGRFPAEQKLAGLLVVDPARPQNGAKFAAFTDKVGKDLRHGIIDLETEQDFDKLREITFPIELDSPDNSEVILIPLLESKMHHENLWDAEEFAALKKRLSWIGRISWGGKLRFFVDPIRNETDMVNGTENLRQYTPAINRAFAEYLKKRYRTVGKLRQEWHIPAGSFEEAARLIPLRTDRRCFWIDPETGRILVGDPDRTFAWIDYQEMIRITYAALADEIAAYLKSLVNVPVVFKSVGVIGEKMNVSRRYLGYDGVGFECYLNQGIPGETGGGASRAEAEASEHTMWKVGTEIGHSAAVGNDGTKFFRDEAELRGMAENLARLGVSGFYFFGFDLKPGNLWSNHNYHDFPEGLAWAARIDREFAAPGRKPVAATPRNYVFPGGNTWWWWITRHMAFHGREQNLIPQSARLAAKPLEWYSSTNTLPEEFDAVIINCPNPPFSRYYAEEIGRALESGRQVSYVGSRSDLGTIPPLDRFFTEETIRFADGSTAQVLKPLPGAVVLAAENGRAWALRAGNLTIVSRTPDKPPVNRADDFLRYLSEFPD